MKLTIPPLQADLVKTLHSGLREVLSESKDAELQSYWLAPGEGEMEDLPISVEVGLPVYRPTGSSQEFLAEAERGAPPGYLLEEFQHLFLIPGGEGPEGRSEEGQDTPFVAARVQHVSSSEASGFHFAGLSFNGIESELWSRLLELAGSPQSETFSVRILRVGFAYAWIIWLHSVDEDRFLPVRLGTRDVWDRKLFSPAEDRSPSTLGIGWLDLVEQLREAREKRSNNLGFLSSDEDLEERDGAGPEDGGRVAEPG